MYGAGELGGICANQYQGGGNLAECLIFGKIAGENAAKPKEETTQLVDEKAVAKPDANTSASVHQTGANDLLAEASPDITVGEHQYLGRSDDGIGGQVVVRITYVDQQLTHVEVVEQHETGEVGGQAVAELPAKWWLLTLMMWMQFPALLYRAVPSRPQSRTRYPRPNRLCQMINH